MAVYAPTRADLRQELARMMQDAWASTTTSVGTSTTAIDTMLTQANNFWRNAWFLPTSGTYSGTEKQVSSSTLSTNTLTVGPAYGGALASGITYELFKRFSAAVYQEALNQAIREVGSVALVDKVDVSLTLAANTWEYTLPSGFRYIRRMSYLNGTTDDTRVFLAPDQDWYIRFASTRKIVFGGSLNFPANTLMIEGQSAPAEMTLDATTCPVQPNYLLAYGKFYLHSILAGSDDDEASYHERQMLIWEKQYEKRKADMSAHVYPGSKSIEPF